MESILKENLASLKNLAQQQKSLNIKAISQKKKKKKKNPINPNLTQSTEFYFFYLFFKARPFKNLKQN